MNKNSKPANRNSQARIKQETKSAGVMRFFYVLMLMVTVLSLVLRVSNARRPSTPNPGRDTTARVLVFHHEESNLCEDLVISAAGNAIYSKCGNSTEKQYALSNTERAQLQGWIEKFKPVNYDHNISAQSGTPAVQLYLNGSGNQQPGDSEIQTLIAFAEMLDAKIASQS
jgi:hypothetical protein